MQLEVVANAEGLKLLRADTSPYPERIRRMALQFNNISFLACNRAIEKLRMNGIDVHLLPEARVIPGALEEIVDRLQQGWVYIRGLNKPLIKKPATGPVFYWPIALLRA